MCRRGSAWDSLSTAFRCHALMSHIPEHSGVRCCRLSSGADRQAGRGPERSYEAVRQLQSEPVLLVMSKVTARRQLVPVDVKYVLRQVVRALGCLSRQRLPLL